MKRIIGYISLIIIFLALGILGLLNRKETLNKEILDKDYYRYNSNNGTYEKIKLTKDNLSYDGTDLGLNTCKKYEYNKETNTITLDCGKNLRVISSSQDILVLEIEENKYIFNTNKEKIYNDSFEKFFGMTIQEYNQEGESKLEGLKINYDRLNEIFASEESNYIYLKSNTCSNDCILFNQAFSNMTNSNNKFVLNIDELSDEQYNNLVTSYEGLKNSKTEYKYPSVLVIRNRKVEEIAEIEYEGFNIEKYNNYFKTSEVPDEENN